MAGKRLNTRARKEVRGVNAPVAKGIRNDYQSGLGAVGNSYGTYQTELNRVPELHTQQIGNVLNHQLGQFSDMLSGVGGPGIQRRVQGNAVGLSGGEAQAGKGLYGAIGSNAFSDLASMAARAGAYDQSAARSGSLAEVEAKNNLLTSRNDALEELRAGIPGQVLQREDQLRQMQLDAQAQKDAQTSNDAFSKWLRQYILSQQAPAGNGNGRRKPSGTPAPVDPFTPTPGYGRAGGMA